MSFSFEVAVTNYHRLSGFNKKYLFLTVLEAENSEIRVSAWLGLIVRTFFLVSALGGKEARAGVSSYEGT